MGGGFGFGRAFFFFWSRECATLTRHEHFFSYPCATGLVYTLQLCGLRTPIHTSQDRRTGEKTKKKKQAEKKRVSEGNGSGTQGTAPPQLLSR